MKQELLKTTKTGKGRGSHYHIVFIDEETGAAYCSTAKDGHYHDIEFSPATEAFFDETTGSDIPETDAEWLVFPAGIENHMHLLEEYAPSVKSKEPEGDVLKHLIAMYSEASSAEEDSHKKALEAERYYEGNQWDELDRNNLEALSRAALTMNYIKKRVDEIRGFQMQQQTDIRYVPVEESDQAKADIVNVVSKRILSSCFYSAEEVEAFFEATKKGRGAFNLYISFDDDLRGDIIVESYSSDQFTLGPNEKWNASDREYQFKEKLYSLNKIKAMWPDKADLLQRDFDWYDLERVGETKEHTTYKTYQYERSQNYFPLVMGDKPMVDIQRREFRVVECWRKEYEKIPTIVNEEFDFIFNAARWKPADVEAVKTLPGFRVIEAFRPKMRIIKACGRTILSDEDFADLPDQDYYLIPFFANKNKQRFWGLIEGSKDAQRLVNKLYSLSVDIVNRMASYGYFITPNTFTNRKEKEKFKEGAAKTPGFVVEVSSMADKPQKEEGTKFPSEVMGLMESARGILSELMNITVEPTGANQSHAHFVETQKQKLLGNEFLFNSLKYAKVRLGRLLLGLIQRYYDADRIRRILLAENARNPVTIDEQPLSAMDEGALEELLEDADFSKLDVEVVETASSPTQRLASFLLMRELVETGVPVPPELFLELADVPADIKRKTMESLTAQQEGQTQAANLQSQTEIDKTLIAQGHIPPDIAASRLRPPPQGEQMPEDEIPADSLQG